MDQYTETLDALRRLAKRTANYDIGAAYATSYNTRNVWSCANFTEYFTNGQRTQLNVTNDNGSTSTSYYGVGNTTWWSEFSNYFVGGQLINRVVIYDDGRTVYTTYDFYNSQCRALIQQEFSATGTYVATYGQYDNATWSYLQRPIAHLGHTQYPLTVVF